MLLVDSRGAGPYQKHMDAMLTKSFLIRGVLVFCVVALAGGTDHCVSAQVVQWRIGTPIVTYWAGPAITDQVARQMAEGGFNVVWCRENELDVAHRHGLRALLHDGLINPESLDRNETRDKLDALIARVRNHPAMYAYFITDEPSASAFPALGKLVSYLRERDPKHLAYINLFPTYASNEQLGTKGDVVTAYAEHLDRFIAEVKPALLSYDHYQFRAHDDGDQYFLNLAMIRRAALRSGIPFLNIVQACSWTPSMRVPNSNEMRYLVYTTAAYGAQGISYYVYCCQGHTGGIALSDGTPTELYHALKVLNRRFVAIASELLDLRSLAVYHTHLKEAGCEPLPADSVFKVESTVGNTAGTRGFLLGLFGRETNPTHAMVVNLDYRSPRAITVIGPSELEKFSAEAKRWEIANSNRLRLNLDAGAGVLVRIKP